MKENQIVSTRDIEVVTIEIKEICRQAQNMALMYAIEVGRRLQEAKSLLPHGEWGTWLKEKVNFSQSSANNFMRIFDEYGSEQLSLFGTTPNSQTFGNLPYTKALALIAIPEDERETFAEENKVENLSTRELDKLIKERDEALKEAQRAKELEDEAEDARRFAEEKQKEAEDFAKKSVSLAEEVNTLQEQLDKAKEAKKKAESKYKELKDNPEIPPEVIEKLKSEAEATASEKSAAEISEKIAEATKAAEAAEAAKAAAEREVERANKKIDDLQRQLQLSNPDVTAFKTLFEQTQEDVKKMYATLKKITEADSALGEKLGTAVSALFRQYLPQA